LARSRRKSSPFDWYVVFACPEAVAASSAAAAKLAECRSEPVVGLLQAEQHLIGLLLILVLRRLVGLQEVHVEVARRHGG